MASKPIVHLEFAAHDPQATGKFYADLFDWQLNLDPAFNYLMFAASPGPGGAFVGEGGNENYQAREVLVYVASDDIEATLCQAEALGGRTLTQKTEIPNVGWFGIFADPDDRRVGLFTPMSGAA